MRTPHAQHENALGFRVWRQRPMPPMSVAHTHADIELNFMASGLARYLYGGAEYEIGPNQLGVFWGGIPHRTLPPGIAGEGIWITIPLVWFLQWELPNDLPHRLFSGQMAVSGLDGEAGKCETWFMDYESGKPERRRVLLLELQARMHRVALEQTSKRSRNWKHQKGGLGLIERITSYIAEHYRDSVSVQGIADAVELNPKYLMRLFRKECGLSVWEYLTRLRVSHAQRLLLTTDWKVVDVALESGFSSVAPFYAAFAVYSGGMRPLDYRKKAKL